MGIEKASYLPKMSKESMVGSIDLLHKDGDPRKTAYVVGMLMNYHRVVEIWKDLGQRR